MNTTGSVSETVANAIDESIHHNETTELDCRHVVGDYDSLESELLPECEGDCYESQHDQHTFWGTDCDGHDWQVRLTHCGL
jgi:hypothetical protein